jgi:HEAT repeat protein
MFLVEQTSKLDIMEKLYKEKFKTKQAIIDLDNELHSDRNTLRP